MALRVLKNILRKALSTFGMYGPTASSIEYWRQRTIDHGKHAVLDIRKSPEEYDALTKSQRELLFPLLKAELTGRERIVLDLGCGPGRFSADLASMIKGRCVAVDPIMELIEFAPKEVNVEYRLMEEGNLPVEESSVDIVWSCLVLGGITDKNLLSQTISEVQRVMAKGALVFLVENTTEGRLSSSHWVPRSVEDYQAHFSFVNLRRLFDYFDYDERISVMVGRTSGE